MRDGYGVRRRPNRQVMEQDLCVATVANLSVLLCRSARTAGAICVYTDLTCQFQVAPQLGTTQPTQVHTELRLHRGNAGATRRPYRPLRTVLYPEVSKPRPRQRK